ncbi:MAG: phosphoribosylanthranilate isomerase [Bacillota bacterium]|nr:phosphoribosylanthranilate isomerase [Bacillota bacterium]
MTKVKVCGLRRVEDIGFVNELNPDYVGFVFAKSKRKVDLGTASELIKNLKENIHTVGVFVNEDPQVVRNIGETLKLKVLQFHGDEDGEYISKFKDFTVWKVISVQCGEEIDEEEIKAQLLEKLQQFEAIVDGIVLDSSIKGVKGGTGISFDWNILKTIQFNKPFVLAGGLNPSNAQEAILKASPQVLDVSSGVETEGVKDFNKIKDFIEKVRN